MAKYYVQFNGGKLSTIFTGKTQVQYATLGGYGYGYGAGSAVIEYKKDGESDPKWDELSKLGRAQLAMPLARAVGIRRDDLIADPENPAQAKTKMADIVGLGVDESATDNHLLSGSVLINTENNTATIQIYGGTVGTCPVDKDGQLGDTVIKGSTGIESADEVSKRWKSLQEVMSGVGQS